MHCKSRKFKSEEIISMLEVISLAHEISKLNSRAKINDQDMHDSKFKYSTSWFAN